MNRFEFFGFMLVVGSIVVSFNKMIGCSVMVIGFIPVLKVLAEGMRGESGYWPTREEAENDLLIVRKQMGIDSYTKAELKDIEQAERENHNSHAQTTALLQSFGYAEKTYVDYDGNLVEVNKMKYKINLKRSK